MKEERKTDFGYSLERVRRVKPVVQCITNFVTVNDCANIILASGGSPSMSMDIREVEESVESVGALVCNMGAIDYVDSMVAAGIRANQIRTPAVLDPVAAGGTQLRRESAKRLLEEVHFTAIRGNASEIRHLAAGGAPGSGVDVSLADEVTEENLRSAIEMTKNLSRRTGAVIILSGKIDIVTDGHAAAVLRNGCATMSRITGSGCMATSLVGTFCGADREDSFRASVSAMAVMGIAGEIAEEKRLHKGTGNATFRTDLIDAVFSMEPETVNRRIRCECF